MINSFWGQLRKFGIARIFMSADFLISLFAIIAIERLTLAVPSYNLDYSQIINVLVGLFAFVFAALAILIAMSETAFNKKMVEMGKYESLLFHYWYTCNALIVAISFTLFVSLARLHEKYVELLAIFLTIYSLCLMLELVKTTISAGIYKSYLDNKSAS